MDPTFFYILAVVFTLLILIYTGYIVYLQLMPGAFYYPSTKDEVSAIIKLAKPRPSDLLIDLGSGDGRIIIAAAKMGIKSIGYELDPILVKKSRKTIKQLNLSHLAQIKFKNFWQADFNQANIVCIYQFPKYINKLEKVFQNLNHPITVITNRYPFPHQKPYLVKNNIYFYKFN